MRPTPLAFALGAWLVFVITAAPGCRRSAFEVNSLDVGGPTLEHNPVLGLNANELRDRFAEALQQHGGFKLVDQKEAGKYPWQLTLELAYTRESQRDGQGQPRAEVASMLLLERKEGALKLRYEVNGRGEAEVSGQALEDRQRALRKALDGSLTDVLDAARLQLRARDKSDQELIDDLKEPDTRRREFATKLLVERRNPAAVDPLVQQLSAKDPEAVRRAMGALVDLKEPSAVPALIDLAKGKDVGFVKELVFALGAIGGEEAESYLYTLSQGHDQPAIRAAAEQALTELQSLRAPDAGPP
jgi:hypothetical protein